MSQVIGTLNPSGSRVTIALEEQVIGCQVERGRRLRAMLARKAVGKSARAEEARAMLRDVVQAMVDASEQGNASARAELPSAWALLASVTPK